MLTKEQDFHGRKTQNELWVLSTRSSDLYPVNLSVERMLGVHWDEEKPHFLFSLFFSFPLINNWLRD